jgi:hypothetical protein
MDGHSTHEQPELLRRVYKFLDTENLEIILLCFPSKTTHKTQPLDVLVFSAIERRWQDICTASVKNGNPINRYTVIPTYVRGTRDVMTKNLITRAFEKTGIYPVNRAVFTPEDFAPSMASSIIAHVPESFPSNFPSSDPIEPSDMSEDSDYMPSDEQEMLPDLSERRSESNAPGSLGFPVPEAAADHASHVAETQDCLEDLAEEIEQDSVQHVEDDGNAVIEDHTDQPEALDRVSGFMAAFENLQTKIVHMTRSATGNPVFTLDPPKVVPIKEDRNLSHEKLLHELRSVRRQLWCTHNALRHALGQANAAEAHCTFIKKELGDVKKQLDNARKSKE